MKNLIITYQFQIQPHSEISALAIVLDRLHKGKQFDMKFDNSARRIIPTKKGKKVVSK
jgi:Uncharacterized protein conserved in archaea